MNILKEIIVTPTNNIVVVFEDAVVSLDHSYRQRTHLMKVSTTQQTEMTEFNNSGTYIISVKNVEKIFSNLWDQPSDYENMPWLVNNTIFAMPKNIIELRKIKSAKWIFDKAICWYFFARNISNNECIDVINKIAILFLEFSRADITSYIIVGL